MERDQAAGGDQGKEEQGEQRCKCNKLICVINGKDIEIKCNKCKRMIVIQTGGITGIDIR